MERSAIDSECPKEVLEDYGDLIDCYVLYGFESPEFAEALQAYSSKYKDNQDYLRFIEHLDQPQARSITIDRELVDLIAHRLQQDPNYSLQREVKDADLPIFDSDLRDFVSREINGRVRTFSHINAASAVKILQIAAATGRYDAVEYRPAKADRDAEIGFNSMKLDLEDFNKIEQLMN